MTYKTEEQKRAEFEAAVMRQAAQRRENPPLCAAPNETAPKVLSFRYEILDLDDADEQTRASLASLCPYGDPDLGIELTPEIRALMRKS